MEEEKRSGERPVSHYLEVSPCVNKSSNRTSEKVDEEGEGNMSMHPHTTHVQIHCTYSSVYTGHNTSTPTLHSHTHTLTQ